MLLCNPTIFRRFTRMLSFLRIVLRAHATVGIMRMFGDGGFDMIPTFLTRRPGDARVTSIDQLPDELRQKCERRLSLLYPRN